MNSIYNQLGGAFAYRDKAIYKTQVLEIQVPITGNTFKFPDQPNLRDARIFDLAVYTENTCSVSPETGSAVISIADMKRIVVTMQEGGDQVIQNRPLLAFNTMVSADDEGLTGPYTNTPSWIRGKIFSWDKCFLTIRGGVATGAGVVPLEVLYDDSEVNNARQ
jgi:hypothetical protein